MKKVLFIIIVIISLGILSQNIYAKSGCCSHHGGVCGSRCCDGTALSSECGGSDDLLGGCFIDSIYVDNYGVSNYISNTDVSNDIGNTDIVKPIHNTPTEYKSNVKSTFEYNSGYSSDKVKVKGYYRKNGTYVKEHYRSKPHRK